MGLENPIYDSSNNFLGVDVPAAVGATRTTHSGLPLGKAANGELGLKTISLPVSSTAEGYVESPEVVVATGNGTLLAGATAIRMLTSSDFTGTIGGATIPPNVSLNFAAQPGNSLASLSYTVATGSIIIITQVPDYFGS